METATVTPREPATRSTTIAELLPRAVERFGPDPAVLFKGPSGDWTSKTFTEVGRTRTSPPATSRTRRSPARVRTPDWLNLAADFSAASSDLNDLEAESNYFDCDFLNMRSIFSFVASQQAWLA